MATSKINYANLRSAQRKNKSMHEVKDLLTKNPYSNFAIHTNQSPPFALEQNTKLHKDELIPRGKPIHSLFDEVSRPDKFDHHKQLPSKAGEHPTVGKGHHSRTKSSITEMYQKDADKQDLHPRNPDALGFGRAETSTNKHSIMKHNFPNGKRPNEQLISNFDDEYRHREDAAEVNYNPETVGYRRPSLAKEGTALDDFLHKNRGFGNGPTSPEEKLYRKTPIGGYEQTASPGDKKKLMKISMEKSANNDTIEEIISPKGDFLSKIDNYIGYFKKSEITQRKMSKGMVEYFTEDEETYNEDGAQEVEMKIIKKHVEGLNTKVKKVLKTNQKLVKEFGDMLAREGEYTQRLGGLEDEFVLLKHVNKKYRDKLKETTHLLEKERMDNQSNLLALKKVLSKGINMALENKIRRYMDHHKDLAHKRKDDRQERDEWKDRKSTDKRQSQRRDESSYVQKASMYSNDEPTYPDKRTERGNRDDEEEEHIESRGPEEPERYNYSIENRLNDKREDDWKLHYQHKNKDPSRDQQIRAIQNKISYLMEDQGPDAKYNNNHHHHHHHQQHDKLMNQVWPRVIAPGAANMKQSKTKYSDKHSIEINDQHHGYGSVNKEKHGHRPKVNTFFIRQE